MLGVDPLQGSTRDPSPCSCPKAARYIPSVDEARGHDAEPDLSWGGRRRRRCIRRVARAFAVQKSWRPLGPGEGLLYAQAGQRAVDYRALSQELRRRQAPAEAGGAPLLGRAAA